MRKCTQMQMQDDEQMQLNQFNDKRQWLLKTGLESNEAGDGESRRSSEREQGKIQDNIHKKQGNDPTTKGKLN